MKRLSGTLVLILIVSLSALAFRVPSEKQIENKLLPSNLEFTTMQKDAHLVLSKYARMQARNTRYTFDILSSRISFDYKISLYNSMMKEKNQIEIAGDPSKVNISE